MLLYFTNKITTKFLFMKKLSFLLIKEVFIEYFKRFRFHVNFKKLKPIVLIAAKTISNTLEN